MAAATATADAPVLPDRTTPFNRKDRVVAAVDMPGIPAGTAGRVFFVTGFEWIRYWVRWENGVVRGSMNRNVLVRPGEPYGDELAALEAAAAEAAAPVEEAGAATAGSGEGAGGVVVAGVEIPAHLIERSKKRREALGA